MYINKKICNIFDYYEELASSLCLLLGVLLVYLMVGSATVPPLGFGQIVPDGSGIFELKRALVLGIRLPRAAAVMICGAILAKAAVIFSALSGDDTQSPLTSGSSPGALLAGACDSFVPMRYLMPLSFAASVISASVIFSSSRPSTGGGWRANTFAVATLCAIFIPAAAFGRSLAGTSGAAWVSLIGGFEDVTPQKIAFTAISLLLMNITCFLLRGELSLLLTMGGAPELRSEIRPEIKLLLAAAAIIGVSQAVMRFGLFPFFGWAVCAASGARAPAIHGATAMLAADMIARAAGVPSGAILAPLCAAFFALSLSENSRGNKKRGEG